MYTLKIRQHHWRQEGDGPESHESDHTRFVECSEVVLGAKFEETTVAPDPGLEQWRAEDVDEVRSDTIRITDKACTVTYHAARMIGVLRPNGDWHWYVASNAWLLGADGRTIENLSV